MPKRKHEKPTINPDTDTIEVALLDAEEGPKRGIKGYSGGMCVTVKKPNGDPVEQYYTRRGKKV